MHHNVKSYKDQILFYTAPTGCRRTDTEVTPQKSLERKAPAWPVGRGKSQRNDPYIVGVSILPRISPFPWNMNTLAQILLLLMVSLCFCFKSL